MPPHFLETFLEAFLAAQPADSPLAAGAQAFGRFVQDRLRDDPVVATRTDRFGLCLVRRSGQSLRLAALQSPKPGPPPVPVMGQMSLGAVGEMAVPHAQPVRGPGG